MILFDTCINIIEAGLFGIFLSFFFNLKNKVSFIAFTTTAQLLLLSFASYINDYGIWLTATIVFLMIGSLIIWNKKIKFEYFYTTLLYNSMIIISVILAMLLCRLVSDLFCVTDPNIDYILRCIFAKGIQLFLTVLALKKKEYFQAGLTFNDWSSVLVLNCLNLAILAATGYAVTYGFWTTLEAYIVLFLSFVVAIISPYTFKQVELLYNEKLKFEKTESLIEFNNQKLAMMNRLKDEIASINHRTFYILYQLELNIENQELTKQIIANYKNNINKYRIVTDTKNAIFDCFYSLKINDLTLKGMKIKNAIFISENEYYNSLKFINFITDLLDLFSSCEELEVFINEVNQFVVIRIIYDNKEFNLNEICEYLDKNLTLVNSYNIKNAQAVGIRICMSMNEDE